MRDIQRFIVEVRLEVLAPDTMDPAYLADAIHDDLQERYAGEKGEIGWDGIPSHEPWVTTSVLPGTAAEVADVQILGAP